MNIPVTIERSCSSCTKCCEGAVHGTVFGEAFFKGSPCKFCLVGSGCSVYEQRPQDPCKTFKCEWLVNDSIPIWMKPNVSGGIIVMKQTKSFVFPVLIPTDIDVSVDVLSWYILWAVQRFQAFVWYNAKGSRFFMGPSGFSDELSELP